MATPSAAAPAVCFLIDRLYRGGTELLLLRLADALARRGFAPSFALLDGRGDDDPALERAAGCPVLHLGPLRMRDARFLPAALRLALFLRHHRVAVLQLHHPVPTAVGLVAATLQPRTRLVRTRFNLGYWMYPNARRVERLAAARADVTVANCEAALEVLRRERHPTPGPTVVIANGIETGALSALVPPAPGAAPRVGMLANLRPVKDPERFVRAARLLADRFPDASFEIAGEGELRPELETLASRLGLGPRLRLPGTVEDVAAFLARIDVAVLCSSSEGLPHAVLEYMAAARPIVATAVGGVPELVRDGREGLLVPPGDERLLADAVGRLLLDRELALRLGAAARERCLATFTMSRTAARFAALYRALYASPLPPLRRARAEARAELAAAVLASQAVPVPELERGGGGRSPVEA